MSIHNFVGRANNDEILKHLVGEKIVGAFHLHTGRIYLVVESGDAVWFCSHGGATPAFGTEAKSDVDRLIAARRAEIKEKIAQLRMLAALEGISDV